MADEKNTSQLAADVLCGVAATAYAAFTYTALSELVGRGLASVPAAIGAAAIVTLTDLALNDGKRISSFAERYLVDQEETPITR